MEKKKTIDHFLFLAGVVNKKSNQHIGCLVHKYFNATILKPNEIDYEDWDGKNINVNDNVKFKVIDLDFSDVLPRIEGSIEKFNSETSEDIIKKILITENVRKECSNDDDDDNVEMELLNSDKFWKEKLENCTKWPEINESINDNLQTTVRFIPLCRNFHVFVLHPPFKILFII